MATTIVLSDLHLHQDFENQKFNLLTSIIEKADKIIINGDLWCGFSINFQEFLKTKWNKLFPLLAQKETIYIYGNHDSKQHFQSNKFDFTKIYKNSHDILLGNRTIHIEHGDKLAPGLEEKHPIIVKNKIIYNIVDFFDRNATKYAYNKYFNLRQKYNEKMKKWKVLNLKEKDTLICGHTHVAEQDTSINYINSGCIRYKKASYIEIQDNKVSLKSLSY